jgi:hypothetical protein
LTRGESLDAIARRTGIRPRLLQAIETARYDQLPRGIYARSAVKAFADALGLDGNVVAAEIEPQLPPLEDPIEGIARVHGIRVAPPSPSVMTDLPLPPPPRTAGHPRPGWRPIAASAIDAGIVLGLVAALIAVTVAVFRIPLNSFGAGAAPAFGAMGVVMSVWYFAVFGGIAGETAGTRLVGLTNGEGRPRVDLPAAGARAFRSAVRDAQVIEELAAWAVSFTAGDRSSASRHDTRPVGQAIGS